MKIILQKAAIYLRLVERREIIVLLVVKKDAYADKTVL